MLFQKRQMNTVKNFFKSFTLLDLLVWGSSTIAVVLSFALCKNDDYLQLAAGLVGVTSLIFISKGNVLGQILSLGFSVLYGIISYFYRYFGEMITYAGMTAPMAIVSIVVWLRHPFRGNHADVTVNRLQPIEYPLCLAISAEVSIVFYFVLRALNTANLIWSTLSVLTSFFAVLLTIRRSPYYALAYAGNDAVLIVLWALAAVDNSKYIAMIVCFAAFLLNDIYGFFNWLKRRERQSRILAALKDDRK